MRLIDEQFSGLPGGGILYDASRVGKPGDAVFERGHWAANHALDEMRGGRGSVAILRSADERWVLRHYLRGGWAAKFATDRYLWTGADRTRSFAEWRLLAKLYRSGLPVPAPIAARYARKGLTYRADLITEYLPGLRTLAEAITGGSLGEAEWRQTGATIASFHHAGVHHADLNAHNILLNVEGQAPAPVYVLDFDRGRIRARGAWEESVLQRLHRSLEKIRSQSRARFEEEEWRWLMAGYREASKNRLAGAARR